MRGIFLVRMRRVPLHCTFLADPIGAPTRSQGGARANWPVCADAVPSGRSPHRMPSAASLLADQERTTVGKRRKAAFVASVIVA